jgi:hypothetical protein
MCQTPKPENIGTLGDYLVLSSRVIFLQDLWKALLARSWKGLPMVDSPGSGEGSALMAAASVKCVYLEMGHIVLDCDWRFIKKRLDEALL